MCRLIFIGFLGLSIAELMILLRTAESIGGFNTFGLTILTAAVGLRYARFESASLPLRIQRQQVTPTRVAVDATLLSLGAFALLLPGFITDVFGLFCLIPLTRSILAKRLFHQLQDRIHAHGQDIHPPGHFRGVHVITPSSTEPTCTDRTDEAGDIIVVKARPSGRAPSVDDD
ncbi:MAG: FxsA family protein [Bradymonadia bacterium]